MTHKEAVSCWSMHDGTEVMYQDPMGRRTPLKVVRLHNRMATVEYASGQIGRVSIGRLAKPSENEYEKFFVYERDSWRHRPNFGIVHNGMPQFFKDLERAVTGGEKCSCCGRIKPECPACPHCDKPVCESCGSHVLFCDQN